MAVNHWLLDWETLDTRPEAVVLSCNIMKFDPSLMYPVLASKTISFAMTIEEQLQEKRTISSSTLKFWMSQNDAARQALYGGHTASSALDGLTAMHEFFHANNTSGAQSRLWGNGADFDIGIWNSLRANYTWHGMYVPFDHRGHRCARTVAAAFPDLKVRPSLDALHDPYHDNHAMAMTLRNIYAKAPELFN